MQFLTFLCLNTRSPPTDVSSRWPVHLTGQIVDPRAGAVTTTMCSRKLRYGAIAVTKMRRCALIVGLAGTSGDCCRHHAVCSIGQPVKQNRR
jgi:hypothetical protein